jgi:hypothetical protein
MKKTLVLLLVFLLFTCHRLYAPIAIFALLNAPVVSSDSVIVNGSASPPTTLWQLEQSSDLSSGIWIKTPQQPVYTNGVIFSCTNALVSGQSYYRMVYGLNEPLVVVPVTTPGLH